MILIIIKRAFILTILLMAFSCNLAPGSYPYAEEYEINVNESELIKTILDFKKDNPRYIMPAQTQLTDGRRNDERQNFWYHIYFFNREENKIIKCWTRPIDKGKTTFAFIGINQGLEIGNWRMINKDFTSSENKEEKKKFEQQILNVIKKNLK